MGPSRHAVRALLAAALLLSAAGAQAATEDFSYIPGSPNGPDRWGGDCNTGRVRQSPIPLSHDRARLVRSLGNLNPTYRPAQATIVNRGHDIQLNFTGDAGGLVINGTAYGLRQLHWHTPSEHTLDGRRYDMELHLVHVHRTKIAVIGVLYKVGNVSDTFLRPLEPAISAVADRPDAEKPVGMVDPNGARGNGSEYYRYMGSLTTPNCTEGVIWTVLKNVSSVTQRQVDLLKQAVTNGQGYEMNARPLQPVNNRDISIFKPNTHY